MRPLNVPAAHGVHASEDMPFDLYDPAAQALTFNPAPVYPASAKHATRDDDPAMLWLLAGQSTHVSFVCAERDLYLPPAHRMHASEDKLFDLYDPGAQASTFEPAPVYPAFAKHASGDGDPG